MNVVSIIFALVLIFVGVIEIYSVSGGKYFDCETHGFAVDMCLKPDLYNYQRDTEYIDLDKDNIWHVVYEYSINGVVYRHADKSLYSLEQIRDWIDSNKSFVVKYSSSNPSQSILDSNSSDNLRYIGHNSIMVGFILLMFVVMSKIFK